MQFSSVFSARKGPECKTGLDKIQIFRKELASGDFKVKQVFFAVPSTRWDEDFAKFEHVLANFPERNEESYAQVAARAAAARAAEQAQAATEDDEDEDDWRKYL